MKGCVHCFWFIVQSISFGFVSMLQGSLPVSCGCILFTVYLRLLFWQNQASTATTNQKEQHFAATAPIAPPRTCQRNTVSFPASEIQSHSRQGRPCDAVPEQQKMHLYLASTYDTALKAPFDLSESPCVRAGSSINTILLVPVSR